MHENDTRCMRAMVEIPIAVGEAGQGIGKWTPTAGYMVPGKACGAGTKTQTQKGKWALRTGDTAEGKASTRTYQLHSARLRCPGTMARTHACRNEAGPCTRCRVGNAAQRWAASKIGGGPEWRAAEARARRSQRKKASKPKSYSVASALDPL